MIKKIYIAGPLFNAHERSFLEEIAHELEANGYDCFLPHRDQTGIEASELDGINMSQTTKDKIFNNDLQGLQVADLTVALVTGPDIDSGTAAEIGFSFATGKPVIAITASERRFRNLFVEGMFAYKVKTVQEIRPTISLVDSSGCNP